MEYTFQGYSKHMKDKLAIIVPYRDRQEHLDVFVPHMHEFLKDKGIDYTIFIAEQTDDRPFNYGKLCNVVIKEIGEEYTYFAFHDIDMLPISDECDYSYPDSPTHLAKNVEAHNNKLPYPQYFGGVVLINREDFEKANGYSNEYWGYGFEDLDLLHRLQISGAYLEKYYDLNQTYSRYDNSDVLPYRIENVSLTNNKKEHNLNGCYLNKSSYFKGRLNTLMKSSLHDSFFISIWFKETESFNNKKNIFCFEGMDTGIWTDGSGNVICQIWDENKNPFDVALKYDKNKWNHVCFLFNNNTKELSIFVNLKEAKVKVSDNFKIHPDYAFLKISDTDSKINIASIITFDKIVKHEVVNELFYNGFKTLDLIKNKYGLVPCNLYTFQSVYSNSILLDSGKNLNHLTLYNEYVKVNELISTTDIIYLPNRLEGKYKSLVHKDDTNIINRYYEYNPDVEENADIFFHEVITDKLDYTTVGLSNTTYKILDKQERQGYELIRIVT